MKKTAVVLMTLILLMPQLLGACRAAKTVAVTAEATLLPAQTENGFTFRYSEESGTVTSENGAASYTVRIRYPVIKNPLTEGTLAVNDAVAEEVKAMVQRVESSQAVRRSVSTAGNAAVCRIEITPCRADESLLSYRVESRTEGNAADSALEISGITFSTQTGSRITLQDFFADYGEARPYLGNAIRSALAQQERADELTGTDWEAVTAAIAEDAFGWYVSYNTFVVLFAADTVADGANGPVTVAVPLQQLSPRLAESYGSQ